MSNAFRRPIRTRLATIAGLFGLALAGGLAAGVSPASAQGAWCAEQGGRNSYTNCGYYTYEQCRAVVSGVGGFCRQNFALVPQVGTFAFVEQPPRRARTYYR
jgi:hypothetical protein